MNIHKGRNDAYVVISYTKSESNKISIFYNADDTDKFISEEIERINTGNDTVIKSSDTDAMNKSFYIKNRLVLELIRFVFMCTDYDESTGKFKADTFYIFTRPYRYKAVFINGKIIIFDGFESYNAYTSDNSDVKFETLHDIAKFLINAIHNSKLVRLKYDSIELSGG